MGDFADREKQRQWDDLAFSLPFIQSLSTYTQRHPEKKLDRILSEITNFIDNDQDYVDDPSFPAAKVLRGLNDMSILAKQIKDANATMSLYPPQLPSEILTLAKHIAQWLDRVVDAFEKRGPEFFSISIMRNLNQTRDIVVEILIWAKDRLADRGVRRVLQAPKYSKQMDEFADRLHETQDSFWDTANIESTYVSVDPFRRKLRPVPFADTETTLENEHDLPAPVSGRASTMSTTPGTKPSRSPTYFLYLFLTDAFPRRAYLFLLLHLPWLYWTRVARVFEDAELSKPDLKKLVYSAADQWEGRVTMETWNTDTTKMSLALVMFKRSWEEFIDSLLNEWNTLNVVSVLLLSAILTVLQIPGAGDDPVTRSAALLSLMCALMSLSYGCVYIMRFGIMKKMHKAASWADEARKRNTRIVWNVWVLLAMPAIWLAWSMILFITCILSFVWRTGSTLDPPSRAPLSPRAALAVRVTITSVFGLGFAYFLMVVGTLRRYGSTMDRKWMERVSEWRKELENTGRSKQEEVIGEDAKVREGTIRSSAKESFASEDFSG